MPWLEIVGAQVFDPAKSGRDVGELAGLGPIGVAATTDADSLLDLDADCVLYCARDLGDHASDAPIMRWLESGKNVITPLPYVYPITRGADVVEMLTNAAQEGGATLAGAGLNPGWISERLVLMATGLSHDIERIEMAEYFDMSGVPEDFSKAFGLGLPGEDAERMSGARELLNQYLPPTMSYVCDNLGVEIERFEQTHEFTIAERDYDLPSGWTLERGAVSMLTSRWEAMHEDAPFFVLQGQWYADAELLGESRLTAGSWTIRIEGRPSVQLVLDLNASMERNEPMLAGDPVPPGYYATVNVMLNLIPDTCAAEPGILGPPTVTPHYTVARGRSMSPVP